MGRGRAGRGPWVLGAPLLRIAAAQWLHPQQPDRVQEQPQREPRITLFAEHFEIARMIGARMFLIDRRFGLLRGVGVIFARRSFDADMILDIGVEAAAQRVFLRIVPCPGPHRDARRSEEHTSELQSLMSTSYAVF